MKATDFGLHLVLGIQPARGIYIQVHYQHGFVNPSPQPDPGYGTFSNVNYGVDIGYLFGSGRSKKPVNKHGKKEDNKQ
jgi:hypothetical protein